MAEIKQLEDRVEVKELELRFNPHALPLEVGDTLYIEMQNGNFDGVPYRITKITPQTGYSIAETGSIPMREASSDGIESFLRRNQTELNLKRRKKPT